MWQSDPREQGNKWSKQGNIDISPEALQNITCKTFLGHWAGKGKPGKAQQTHWDEQSRAKVYSVQGSYDVQGRVPKERLDAKDLKKSGGGYHQVFSWVLISACVWRNWLGHRWIRGPILHRSNQARIVPVLTNRVKKNKSHGIGHNI